MKIDLAVLGSAPPGLVEGVANALPAPLVKGAAIRTTIDVDRCLDRHRVQVDALCLLSQLAPPPGEGVVVGLVDRDLFLPVLTFVFGASSPASRTAVLSWVRLRPDGERGRVSSVFVRRVTTEVVHEAGHAYGLVHCIVQECAMHRSLAPEAVDLKRPDLCPSCREQLRALPGDLPSRDALSGQPSASGR